MELFIDFEIILDAHSTLQPKQHFIFIAQLQSPHKSHKQNENVWEKGQHCEKMRYDDTKKYK